MTYACRTRYEYLDFRPAVVMSIVVMFELPPSLHDASLVIADPDADVFIHCALASESSYIISNV